MTRTPVTSSAIRSIGHDPDSKTLEVEFANGRIYRYDDVAAAQHEELLAAPSLGVAFALAFGRIAGTPAPDHEEE